MINDPKVIGLAFLGGLVPSLLWLIFWIRQEKNKPQSIGLLAIIFIMGMIAVVCVLPVQKFIQTHFESHNVQLVLWASIEEIMKYLAVLIIIAKSRFDDEPIEWPLYMITAALGFAALENTLFLLKPISIGATTVGLLTGQLRFLGSTLLHSISSGIVGVALGISFHMNGFKRLFHLLVGLTFAIGLHSVFNFFIIRNSGNDFLKVFGFLWVVTIIVMLLLEKVRRMS
ncbi:MAG: PrsW family glutamic-type intramembrane protease [Candidatus Paceibacterota bacterium]